MDPNIIELLQQVMLSPTLGAALTSNGLRLLNIAYPEPIIPNLWDKDADFSTLPLKPVYEINIALGFYGSSNLTPYSREIPIKSLLIQLVHYSLLAELYNALWRTGYQFKESLRFKYHLGGEVIWFPV